jgi:hypothetical protein
MNIYSPTISGSLTISGSIITTGGGLPLTGSLVSSGSFTSIGPTVVSGSFTVVTGSAVEFQVLDAGVKIGNLVTDSHSITGSLRVNPNGLFVSSSGNVGIGTTSPGQILTLLNDNTAGTALNIINTSTGGYNWNIFSGGSAATLAPVGSLIFRDSTNGATRLVISSSGNIGIGTSSPSEKLEIYGNATATSNFTGLKLTNSGDGGLKILFTNSVSAELASIVAGVTSAGAGTNDGTLIFSTADNAVSSERMRLTSTGHLQLNNGTALRFNNTAATAVDTLQMFTDGNVYLDAKDSTGGNLIFRTTTSLNERMRITSGGKFLFGTTTDNAGGIFQVKSPSGQNAIVGQVSDNGNAGLVGFNAASGYTFYVLGSGQIYSTSQSIILISSDYNLKTDIKDYDKGLAEVLAMKPRYFKYKDNLEEEKIGFIAQEMEEVIAGSMIDSPMGNHKTYQLEWYPLLVKAIQELKSQNDALQTRIETLEQK